MDGRRSEWLCVMQEVVVGGGSVKGHRGNGDICCELFYNKCEV